MDCTGRLLARKNAMDCGVRGRLLGAAGGKDSKNVVLRLMKGRYAVLVSGFCGFLIVLFTSKLK